MLTASSISVSIASTDAIAGFVSACCSRDPWSRVAVIMRSAVSLTLDKVQTQLYFAL